VAKTVAGAFSDCLRHLELTANQRAQLESRRATTHGYLAEAFGDTSDMPLVRTALIGSASRDTIIRPFDDIDVLAVFGHAPDVYKRYRADSRQFLYRVRDALARFNIRVVGARGQAVRLFYRVSPHVDVAPVLPHADGGYLLPAGDGSWIRTDPGAQARWLGTKRRTAGENLKPLIRLAKQWNRAHSDRLKSFHLEVVVASTFRTVGSLPDSAARFFEWAPGHIAVGDPAGHADDLSSYLTRRARQDVIDSLAAAADRAEKAGSADTNGKTQKAIEQWQIVFGDTMFPAFG